MLDVKAKSKRISNDMLSELFTSNQLLDVRKQLLAIANGKQVVVLSAPSDWKDTVIASFEESVNAYLEHCGHEIRIVMLPPNFRCACSLSCA